MTIVNTNISRSHCYVLPEPSFSTNTFANVANWTCWVKICLVFRRYKIILNCDNKQIGYDTSKKPTSFSQEKIAPSEKEWKTGNTFPPRECLRHFHHASDDFTLFDSPDDPPLTSPYIVEEKTWSFTRRVAGERERERGESPSFQPIVPFTNVTDKDDPRCHFKYQTPP